MRFQSREGWIIIKTAILHQNLSFMIAQAVHSREIILVGTRGNAWKPQDPLPYPDLLLTP